MPLRELRRRPQEVRLKNYRMRLIASGEGHTIVVRDPSDRVIYAGWEPGTRTWAHLVGRDAIARDQAARREVAA